jgi:hypothetical protein
VTRLDTFAQVIRHFGEFGASGHCLIWRQLADLANATKHQTISCLKSNFKNTKQSQIDSAGKLTNTDNIGLDYVRFGLVWLG